LINRQVKKLFLIIGAGRIGTSLYHVLNKSQEGCAHLLGKQEWAAFDEGQIAKEHYSTTLSEDLVEEVKAVVFAVQDDRIKDASRVILKYRLKNKCVFHLSGAKGSAELEHLAARGALTGALHPLQSFANPFEDIHHWKNVLFSFEGDKGALLQARDIAQRAKGRLITVSEEQKVAIHLAGVFSANYLVAMLNIAENILHTAGINDLPANEMLYPLLRGVTFNYAQRSSEKILTGPLVRGDVSVLRRHLAFLKRNEGNSELYVQLARMILENPRFDIADRERIAALIETYK